MNKTDPRVIKTLQRIDESLLENLNRKGFRKITVDMICRSAGINRSTFYRYYADKNELLNSYLNRVLEEFRKATVSAGFVPGTPFTISGDEYIGRFHRMMDFVSENSDVYRILWNASINLSFYQEMEDALCGNILETFQKHAPCSAQEKAEYYYELYARLFASNFMTVIRWWLDNKTSITRADAESVMEDNIQKRLITKLTYQSTRKI